MAHIRGIFCTNTPAGFHCGTRQQRITTPLHQQIWISGVTVAGDSSKNSRKGTRRVSHLRGSREERGCWEKESARGRAALSIPRVVAPGSGSAHRMGVGQEAEAQGHRGQPRIPRPASVAYPGSSGGPASRNCWSTWVGGSAAKRWSRTGAGECANSHAASRLHGQHRGAILTM